MGLLSFFLFQILVRFVGGWHLLKPATQRLVGLVETAGSARQNYSILKEIDAVLRLGEVK